MCHNILTCHVSHVTLCVTCHTIVTQWTAPIALASDYCHPLEHLLVNVLPNLSYAVIFGSDPFSYLLWWILVYLGSQTNHSGYRWGLDNIYPIYLHQFNS